MTRYTRITEGNRAEIEVKRRESISSLLSLKNAIMYAGVDAEGTYHDALYDARNTAALFRTVRDPEACREALGKQTTYIIL